MSLNCSTFNHLSLKELNQSPRCAHFIVQMKFHPGRQYYYLGAEMLGRDCMNFKRYVRSLVGCRQLCGITSEASCREQGFGLQTDLRSHSTLPLINEFLTIVFIVN